jgi:hypothetical protein
LNAVNGYHTCEVHCVAGCCGLDAFDVAPEHMLPWMWEHGVQRAWQALDPLSEVIHELAEHIGEVTSEEDEFNALWSTSGECCEFLRGWQRVIVRSAEMLLGRPLLDPCWLSPTPYTVAQYICEERAFDHLGVLADALEDAGCDNAEILGHLRGPGPHVRGCWVVDLILGKA